MARSMASKRSYFQANKDQFNLWGGREKGKGLRECQLGAYWAVWAHFTTTHEPALVSLPTGAGKTALMMALSFGFEAERVLIITPAQLLRDQIAREFGSLDILKKIEVVNESIAQPRALSNANKLQTENAWRALAEYDVVSATPKTTSPAEEGVCQPPPGLFDLVFLDEAHHAPAPTWAAILKALKGTKCILLTATPFRRDKRGIRAPLIYHYPVAKAIEDGIYRPIKYHAVESSFHRAVRDKALCKVAKKVLVKERERGNQSKLLIRTNRVEWADRLVHLYNENDKKDGREDDEKSDTRIKVKAVDYTKSWPENQATIQALRDDELDGLVCVGMVGEGLDLPELKIAVLHSAPRSLPYTLQFIGRISRFPDRQTGDAHLIAVPDEVRGEMRRLYASDGSWRKLIPKLADEAIGKVAELRHFGSTYTFEELETKELDINLLDLKPFLSVCAYRLAARKDKLDEEGQPDSLNLLVARVDEEVWPENLNIYLREPHPADENLVVLITGLQKEPAWARDTGIQEIQFDLHVFYHHEEKKLLFEATTSDTIAQRIRLAMISDQYTASPIDPNKIMRLLQEDEDYSMLGLRNVTGRGPAVPSYKTLMGAEVEAALRPTDRKTFALGHALRRLSRDELRGISTLHGRIWACKRANVDEFRNWCNRLADELEKPPTGPVNLSLALAEDIDKLPERPLSVQLDNSLLRAIIRTEIIEPESKEDDTGEASETKAEEDDTTLIGEPKTEKGDIVPHMEIIAFEDGKLECEFCFHSAKPGIRLRYSASAEPVWERLDERDLRIRLEFSDTDIFDNNLLHYLARFPPSLVMPMGGVVINRQHWKPIIKPGPLPVHCIQILIWSGCDTKDENSIHDWLQKKLTKETSEAAIVIKDHRRGEIADFVAIEPAEGKKQIIFYHCKRMTGKSPGDSVGDAYEVLGQACRNGRWILSPKLMQELDRHTQPPRNSPIVKGNAASLSWLADSFNCNTWTYRVVVVQPGFDCREIVKSNKVYPLLVATHEWLSACEAEFAIWGNEKSEERVEKVSRSAVL